MKLTPKLTAKLSDPTAEAVRRNVDRRIDEFQQLPLAHAVSIVGVTLPDMFDQRIAHGLGRAPKQIIISPPYPIVNTAGAIFEERTATLAGYPIDRTKEIVLRAFGWGVTITIDLLVF